MQRLWRRGIKGLWLLAMLGLFWVGARLSGEIYYSAVFAIYGAAVGSGGKDGDWSTWTYLQSLVGAGIGAWLGSLVFRLA